MIKAFIIADIQQARIALKKDLETYASDVQIIGEANGVIEGAKLLKNIQPDILFLDIQMQDESGFDLLDILKDISFKKPNESLALHTQDKIHIVNINDILRCESSVNYTEFHFSGGKKLLVTKTLKDFEDLLSDQGFYRVHQSHLVNTKYIKEFVKTDGGYLLMNDGFNAPVSARKTIEVIKMLQEL